MRALCVLAAALGMGVLLPAALGGDLRHSNGLIAFTRQDASGVYRIFVMSPDGTGQRSIATNAYAPVWSPDGRRIAYIDQHDRLAVMNADGSGKRVLTQESGAASDGDPQWSPNGKRLVFVVYHGGAPKDITLIRADGTGKHRLRVGLDPDWSPDGRRIAFSNLIGQLFTVKLNGHGLTRLTRAGCSDLPRWSPDGRKILFLTSGDCLDPHRIAVMNANGSGLRKLTPKRAKPRWNGQADWAPDGTKIVFAAARAIGPIGNIYVMSANGSHRQQLTSNGLDFDPTWQPR